MNFAILQNYRRRLTSKAAELRRKIWKPRVFSARPRSRKIPPQPALTLDEHARFWTEIQAALHRIEGGTFAVCERCRKPIPPNRLTAVPWTRYCIHCRPGDDPGPEPGSALLVTRQLLAA
jgi:hypothetical protein